MASFSRQFRLVSKRDFQWVFAKPQKVTTPYLLALCRASQLPYARLGIIINKHHVKHAVARNRWRRVIRESFRHHQAALKRLDIIIIMRSECSRLSKKILRDDADQLWNQLVKYVPPCS